MKKGTVAFVGFILGTAIGSVATWQFLKKKYEDIANYEIESVREFYEKKQPNTFKNSENNDRADVKKDNENEQLYFDIINKNGYTDYSNAKNTRKEENKKEEHREDYCYVISPDEFGVEDDYETVTYTYYSDNVLADENEEPVEDIISIIGPDALNSFGEYDDDTVYVRNDRLKLYFEILRDNRTYESGARPLLY